MNKVLSGKILTVLLLSTLIGLTGCSSKKANPDDGEARGPEAPISSNELVLEVGGDSDSSRAGKLRTVFFAYDSSELSYETKAALDENAMYLKENTNVEIQIEGHCDERGGVQYNIALGERRANATRTYLTALGVSSSRIRTVSYGKEKPLAYGHNEDAWSQNRRANFVVTSK